MQVINKNGKQINYGVGKMKMKDGYTIWVEPIESAGCSNGNYPAYEVLDEAGNVVQSGITCRCGRGCSGTDCIRDDWGDHDTDIEKYRGDDANAF